MVHQFLWTPVDENQKYMLRFIFPSEFGRNFAKNIGNSIMWKLYALLSALFAALTAIFAKLGVRNIDSDLATAIRTTIVLALTWGIVLVSDKMQSLRTSGTGTWVFLILSGIATGLSWLFYFKALQIGDASKVVPLDKLSIVFTIILAVIILKEPLTMKVVVGASLITAGAIIMVWK